MGVSEVLLCPYRCLEYSGKTRKTQNSTLLTEGAVTTENGRLFHTFVILMLNEYFRRL